MNIVIYGHQRESIYEKEQGAPARGVVRQLGFSLAFGGGGAVSVTLFT